jgi:hypothetical protein
MTVAIVFGPNGVQGLQQIAQPLTEQQAQAVQELARAQQGQPSPQVQVKLEDNS